MSETVHWKGKLTRLSTDGEGLESYLEKILTSNLGKEKSNNEIEYYMSYCDNKIEAMKEVIRNEYYEEYYIKDKNIYKIEKYYVDPYLDIFSGEIINDNEVKFDVRYYNGGCCLHEALDLAIKNSKESL